MYQEVVPVILPVCHLILSERHIAHRHVKEIIRVVCLFKTGDFNIGFRVELFCNPPGDPVQFHTVQPALLHLFRQHTKEIPDAHCRLQYIPFLKTHLL